MGVSSMSTVGKRVGAFAAVLAIALAVAFGTCVGKAYAGGGAFDIEVVSSGTVGLPYDKDWGDWWNKYSFYAKGKVTQVKSSNTSVLEAKAGTGSESKTLGLTVKKPGKSTLTYKVGGKKHSVGIVVRQYRNPFKTYMLAGKNHASLYKKSCSAVSKAATKGFELTGKVNVKPAKGWKVKAINASVPGAKNSLKRIKNGSALPDGTTTVQVLMTNTKTKVFQRAYLYTAS